MSRSRIVIDVVAGEQTTVPFTSEEEAEADALLAVASTVTADMVWAEKDRRWALGFDYDFGDDHGVHHIGTTEKDMEDWQKVQALATAATQLGQPDTPIYIVTDTGAVTIKASEWWNIVIAMAMFQQPIFQGAVALVAMDSIPADYATNDVYWTAPS